MSNATKPEQLEMVVYHLFPKEEVSRLDEYENWPNERNIAQAYGCRLEFRKATFHEAPGFIVNGRYHGIEMDGSTLSAVLVGDDYSKLERAKKAIHQACGVGCIEGSTSISDEKLPL